MAQGIVGGMWPKTQEHSKKICQDISGEQIYFQIGLSQQGCTTGGQQDSVNGQATGAEKDEVIKNKNFIWDALGNSDFSTDTDLKMFVMTLVGTDVFDANGKMSRFAGKITDLIFFAQLCMAMFHLNSILARQRLILIA